jgi:hypothetical protein
MKLRTLKIRGNPHFWFGLHCILHEITPNNSEPPLKKFKGQYSYEKFTQGPIRSNDLQSNLVITNFKGPRKSVCYKVMKLWNMFSFANLFHVHSNIIFASQKVSHFKKIRLVLSNLSRVYNLSDLHTF